MTISSFLVIMLCHLNSVMEISELKMKAAQIRVDVLTAIYKAGSGQTGSSMSVIEILIALYYGSLGSKPILNVDPGKPGSLDQDYVVLSKGHAVISQYAILADLGFFDKDELKYYKQVNSMLEARPSQKVPGICASSASPGLGFSIAVGLAMSLKMERRQNKVFAVLGDAELQMGVTWESATLASHYNLQNLVAFIDNDGFQEDGPLKAVLDVGSIQDKFEAFGWKVIHVLDGHDFDQLLDALHKAFSENRKPVCIWCHTITGKGIGFAEDKSGYHGAALSEVEMNEVIPKLKEIYENE